MGVTATITIEAEDQEHLGSILAAIGMALTGIPSREAPVAQGGQSPLDEIADWYQQNGGRFIGRLTANAKTALRLIATFPDEDVPVSVVATGIGKHGTALAGTLASIGAATRYLQAPAPPFERDAKRKLYRMSPNVRVVLSALLAD